MPDIRRYSLKGEAALYKEIAPKNYFGMGSNRSEVHFSREIAQMPKLEDAISLAAEAHKNQKDKSGAPYVLHPLRVMLRLNTVPEMMTAVLHDVVEDTGYTLAELSELGYPPDVLTAVDSLTRRPEESYEEFIDRLKPNPLARKVKLADIEDNMDLSRLPDLTPKDWTRIQRYKKARAVLEAVIADFRDD